MIFRKEYGQLVKKSLDYLIARTSITNTTVGGIARSLIEVINLNISEYYDILDVNTAMGFVSTAEGYFLDLIADLFNMQRLPSEKASVTANDRTQKFYVVTGTLYNRMPSGYIPSGTKVTTSDGSLSFTVTSNTVFDAGATEVYVPIEADSAGTNYNTGINTLVKHSLGYADVFTTNERAIIGGADLENDLNFRYRIVNASLSAEKANETAIRLASLSVGGVADVLIKPYSRGVGSFDVIVIPVEGLATDKMIADVQTAINSVQAYGIKGYAIKPNIVPVDIEVKLVFTSDVSTTQKEDLRNRVRVAIEQYIVNIPLGGVFILNELRQQIMDVSDKIKDHIINCYCFREEPTFLGNVEIYWDEMFYPNTDSSEAIRVL